MGDEKAEQKQKVLQVMWSPCGNKSDDGTKRDNSFLNFHNTNGVLY
jgi:hypothetical protein